jgi:hypothetical protein
VNLDEGEANKPVFASAVVSALVGDAADTRGTA